MHRHPSDDDLPHDAPAVLPRDPRHRPLLLYVAAAPPAGPSRARAGAARLVLVALLAMTLAGGWAGWRVVRSDGRAGAPPASAAVGQGPMAEWGPPVADDPVLPPPPETPPAAMPDDVRADASAAGAAPATDDESPAHQPQLTRATLSRAVVAAPSAHLHATGDAGAPAGTAGPTPPRSPATEVAAPEVAAPEVAAPEVAAPPGFVGPPTSVPAPAPAPDPPAARHAGVTAPSEDTPAHRSTPDPTGPSRHCDDRSDGDDDCTDHHQNAGEPDQDVPSDGDEHRSGGGDAEQHDRSERAHDGADRGAPDGHDEQDPADRPSDPDE